MKQFGLVFIGLLFIAAPNVYAQGVIDPIERLGDIQNRRNIQPPAPEQRDASIALCNQGKNQIILMQKGMDSSAKKRLVVYTDIQKEIKAIELRMTKQGADASEIDLLIGKLQQNIDTFTEQSRYANQLTEDTKAINCAVNPELYQAVAGEYKDTRKAMFESASQLKTTILEAPQTTFNPLISRLRI